MNNTKAFASAMPIWANNLENEKFITLGLYAKTVFKSNSVLKIATSGNYRLFINNQFYYCGPTRAAHGFYRVDEIDVSKHKGEVDIAIEVINYSVGSFSDLKQPGFIQVEILTDKRIVAATGVCGFEMFLLSERQRKVQRYSFQRPMAEYYLLTPEMYNWRSGISGINATPVESHVCDAKNLISRNIAAYKFPTSNVEKTYARGEIINDVRPENYFKDRSLVDVTGYADGTPEGYTEKQLEAHLTDEVQEMANKSLYKLDIEYMGTTILASNEYEILSFPCEKTGFISMDIGCSEQGTIYILFDEILSDNDVDPLRLQCCNVIRLDVEKGNYNFQSAEALGMKYVKLICTKGNFTIRNIFIKEMICSQPIVNNLYFQDKKLQSIWDAALETFKQNSVDIFMDCPTRERAGWLCDSYFTAKAEYFLTGENIIEHNFLENYVLSECFENIPDNMVPMCYPADHWDGNYIPNWSLWLIIELSDYKKRNGDLHLIEKFKSRVYKILNWFKNYENADGILEKLPGWVFVEWSKANDLVQDINYPTNMLYSYALKQAHYLYDDNELLKKSDKLKKLIRIRSFNGDFFCDNDVYIGGKLQTSGYITETCQYYAFFTGVATPEEYPTLWENLVDNFGPDRKQKGIYPEVYPSNAFIGNFLRLCLLDDNQYYEQLLKEIKGYFYYMAERTGTLWEHDDVNASCNHGFASYVAVLLSHIHIQQM